MEATYDVMVSCVADANGLRLRVLKRNETSSKRNTTGRNYDTEESQSGFTLGRVSGNAGCGPTSLATPVQASFFPNAYITVFRNSNTTVGGVTKSEVRPLIDRYRAWSMIITAWIHEEVRALRFVLRDGIISGFRALYLYFFVHSAPPPPAPPPDDY